MAINKTDFLTAGINQFAISAVRGMLADWGLNAMVMEVMVSDTEADAIRPGDAVKLTSSTKGIPTVTAATAGDDIYGIAIWNTKTTSVSAGQRVGVLRDGGVMLGVTAEAVTAGDVLYYAAADGSLSKTASGKPVGLALEDTTAVTAGTLFRFEVVKQPIAPVSNS